MRQDREIELGSVWGVVHNYEIWIDGVKVFTTPNSNPLTFDNVQGTVLTSEITV